MYVKIVRNLDDEEGVSSRRGNLNAKVTPTEHWLFESEEINYKKVVRPDVPSLGKGRVVTGEFLKDDDEPFEVLEIMLIKDGEYNYLIAKNCTLYLMNNEGKTIDSIVCR